MCDLHLSYIYIIIEVLSYLFALTSINIIEEWIFMHRTKQLIHDRVIWSNYRHLACFTFILPIVRDMGEGSVGK